MAAVKIRVFGADGKYRGGLFKDYLNREHRWMGTPKPNLQEVMVCDGPVDTGSYYLLELVMPRDVTGDETRDSLLDEKSRCCCRSPVQALFWFSQQAFGPPPALVERVRNFEAKWQAFSGKASARTMLARIAGASFIDARDAQFLGKKTPDLTLLREIDVVHEARSGSGTSYFADSVVQDMGVDGFVTWTNGHLAQVSGFLLPKGGDSKTPLRRPPGTGKARRSPAPATSADLGSFLQEGNDSEPVPKPLRVGYRDVCSGRPDLELPRTPKSTYTRWCKNPLTASDLGVNPKGLVAAQQPLVEGLLRLHAQKSLRRCPPQQRPK